MQVVLVAQPIAPEGIDMLTSQGFEVRRLAACDRDALMTGVSDADALLVRNATVDREVIEAGPRLRVIARHGAGLDTIDLTAASEKGIQVTYTPAANHISVAEHILGMMIALAKNMTRADNAVRAGYFDFRHENYGIELEGTTLGIVGLGNVGRALARKASLGLGMQVIAYDPFVMAPPPDLPIRMASDLGTLLRSADFVSLNVALNEHTSGLIGREQFGVMKPGAYLINCARAEVVVEEALVEAVRSGHLAGAGVDVFAAEPPLKDNPLFALENVIVTPHMAAHTHAAMRRMAVHAAQGIVEVLTDRPVTWSANAIPPKVGR
jgi:D-3-phosphoglycerate dehydrogenase